MLAVMDFLGRARTFVRVVESGSLSKAARSLRMSLAAVSRQITSLEAELGASLLVRTTRSLAVTPEGRRFHEHAANLVREAEAARASVRSGAEIAGRVVVSASVTLGVKRIVATLPALLARYPAFEIDLRLEDRAVDLVSEGVDVSVRAGLALPDTTGVVAQHLATYRRLVVASPAYLRRRGTPKTVASLASHSTVLGTASATRWSFAEDGATVSVTVAPRVRVGTLLGICEAAVAGLGVAVLPEFVVADALQSNALRVVLPSATLEPVAAHALYRTEARGAPRIEAVVNHLREAMPFERDPS